MTSRRARRLPPLPPRFIPVLVVTLLAATGLAVVAPVLGAAADHYELSESEASLLLASFATGRFALTLPAGFLSDRIRFGHIAVVSVAVMTASAGLSALLPPFPLLLLAQVAQGAGSAVFTTAATSWLLGAAEPDQSGRVLALFQGLIVAVYSFSPLMGGIAGDAIGVSGPFVVSGVAGALGLLITATRLLDLGAEAPALPQAPLTSTPARRRPRLLLTRAVLAAAAVGFSARWMVMGLQNTMFPLHASDSLEMSSSTIGTLLTVNGLAMLVTLPLVGRHLDDAGRRPTMHIGLSLAVVAAVGFAGVRGFWSAATVLVVSGGVRALLTPTPMVMAADVATAETRGRVLGFVRSGIEFGGMAGPPTAGILLERFDYTGGSFMFAVMLLLLAAALWSTPESRSSQAGGSPPGP